MGEVREFESGATRDSDTGKYDYEGFMHPLVINKFAEYMHKHRTQQDGNLRDSDNWQKGMPTKECVKSLLRHTMDVWSISRGLTPTDFKTGDIIPLEDALCAISFNVNMILLNLLKGKTLIQHGEL